MPRRREVPKRPVPPDPKYHDRQVAKFTNVVMRRGKNLPHRMPRPDIEDEFFGYGYDLTENQEPAGWWHRAWPHIAVWLIIATLVLFLGPGR